MNQDTLLSVRVFPAAEFRAVSSAMKMKSAHPKFQGKHQLRAVGRATVLVGATQGLSKRFGVHSVGIGVFLNLRETIAAQ